MEATMQSDTLQSQTHSLIASDRVEGTPVRRSDGEKVGTIERLMIDKLSGSVRLCRAQLRRFPRRRSESTHRSRGRD